VSCSAATPAISASACAYASPGVASGGTNTATTASAASTAERRAATKSSTVPSGPMSIGPSAATASPACWQASTTSTPSAEELVTAATDRPAGSGW